MQADYAIFQKQLASIEKVNIIADMKTESEKIIDALGGVATLSKKLDMRRPTIQAWKKRGIPPKIQLAYPKLIAKGRRLVALAEKSGGK